MGTVPTNRMERELRALYLRWLVGVPSHQDDLSAYTAKFEADSRALIARLGGPAASLGALADFPVPRALELSPVANVVYDEMKQAGIKAGIAAGLQATDVARQLLNAGLDMSFRRLNRLARTETVSAYWKNAWDSIADLPAIVMVWGAERGPRTCDYCLSRDGLVVEDGNIRDHPQGRCTPIPTLRSRVNYKGTLQPDGSVFMDPRWSQQSVAKSSNLEDAYQEVKAEAGILSGDVTRAWNATAKGPYTPKSSSTTAGADMLAKRNVLTVTKVDGEIKTYERTKAQSQASAGPTTAAQRDPMSGKSNPAAPSQAQAVHASPTPQRPATPGRNLPAPSQPVVAALTPQRGGWTTSTRAKTEAVLKKTPDGKALLQTMRPFQSGGSQAIPRLKTDIETFLKGGTLQPGRQSAIEQLLGATNAIPVPDAKPLYRGMAIPGSLDDVLARYAPGQNVDLALSSFTSDKKTGVGFAMPGGQAGKRVATKNNVPVVVEWAEEGRTALPIENLSPSRVFSDEKEWVASGQFQVTSSKVVKRNGIDTVYVTMTKVAKW